MPASIPKTIKNIVKGQTVEEEAQKLASFFHFGKLGVTSTLEEVRANAEFIKKKGYKLRAFDIEMTQAKLAVELMGGFVNIHVPISYPMGNMTLNKKLRDLEYIAALGVDENCICLDYFNILSHNYRLVEEEVATIIREFEGLFKITAFVIPSALLNDTEIIDVCEAIASGGGGVIKLNPGFQLNVTIEEVSLIKRVFGNHFDVHPSGGIRRLEEVADLLELNITTIHSSSSMDIVQEFIERRYEEKSGGLM